MLTIKKTTMQTECESRTEKALYEVTYTMENNALSRINCQIYSLNTTHAETGEVIPGGYVGTLVLINGLLSASIPMSDQCAGYIAEFETIAGEIKQLTNA